LYRTDPLSAAGILFAPTPPVLAGQEDIEAISRGHGLEIDNDFEFQQREWNAQRIGWGIMGAVVLAAMLGAFGRGPLSNTSVERDGLRLEYERFARAQNPTSLRFYFAAGEPARLVIGRKYLDAVRIEDITPPPESVAVDGDWLIYSFLARRGTAAATFHLKPQRFGALSGEARLPQREPISFGQFIYP
jgi:hypothetical protein